MTTDTPLTQREQQVLEGMAAGLSNSKIARRHYVSEDTVKTHARRLFQKLGATDRAHAVFLGCRAGLIPGASVPAPPTEGRPPCHAPTVGPRVSLAADDHDAALLAAAMFGPNPQNPDVALQRSRAALTRLVGA